MKFVKLLAISTLIACFAGSAMTPSLAFEQQNSGSAPAPAQPSAGTSKSSSSQSPTSDLASPSNIAETTGGTVVKIPGLGKIGELPKMDFGLELLYGAAETENIVEDTQEQSATSDDLRIRGTIKHQF